MKQRITTHRRLAIIVGVGPGAGLAISKKFSRENFNVALIARDKDHLKKFVEDINHSGGNAFAFPADITKKDEIVSTFNEIYQQLGSAEVLIYNAASKFEMKGICDI